jgi:AraC-like DNA-binding protein
VRLQSAYAARGVNCVGRAARYESKTVMFASVVTISGVIAELARRGIGASQLLHGERIGDRELEDMRTILSADECERIITRAIQLSGNPALGLSVGSNAPDSLFQIVSHLVVSVPSVGHAIEVLARYAPLIVDDLRVSIAREGEHAVLRYDFHCGAQETVLRFAAECFAATCLRLGYAHFAPDDQPVCLRFAYPEPSYVDRYHKVFGCPLAFDQAENAIVCNASILDRRQPFSDTTMEAELRKTADAMLGQMIAPSYAQRLRAMLRQERDLCNLETERIAQRLGVSLRTLRRKLSREGASLADLIEEVRNDIAQSELRRPGATVREVAERLGYSEPSAFHRAFKRWTGETPKAFREGAVATTSRRARLPATRQARTP